MSLSSWNARVLTRSDLIDERILSVSGTALTPRGRPGAVLAEADGLVLHC